MDKIEIKDIEDTKLWEDFVLNYPEANFLQSWAWGEFHKSLGKKIFRKGFFFKNRLIGVMLSIIEDAKRARYLTVPGGPLIDWRNEKSVEVFVEVIKSIAKETHSVFVRVRPQLISDKFSKDLFKKYGFREAPMHLHAELTSQLQLDKSEDELLRGMRKTTRYELRKAISQGIEITRNFDRKLLEKFYKLQIETAKRQNFVPFSEKFLINQFEIFSETNNVLLLSAFKEKNLLAQAFVIFYGKEADYHYGASTEMGRKYPGAYLLQWEAIKEAKKRGIERYNFWGVSPENELKHRFYGVSLFKRGFGGRDIEYLHAQDLVIDNLRYILDWTIENIRRKIRKL